MKSLEAVRSEVRMSRKDFDNVKEKIYEKLHVGNMEGAVGKIAAFSKRGKRLTDDN